MKDLKRSLGTCEKPDITHVRKPIMVAIARACEYGSAKYERSNFLRAQDDAKGDFLRFRSYLRACLSHVVETLDSMEQHQANDPNLLDVEGMDRAAYAADTDPDTTGKVGPSGLPHVYGAAASLMMAISQATQGGLLPDDAGQPWAKTKKTTAGGSTVVTFTSRGSVGVLKSDGSARVYKTLEEFRADFPDRDSGAYRHALRVFGRTDPEPKRFTRGEHGNLCEWCARPPFSHKGITSECPT